MLLMMLVVSIGIAASTLWGALIEPEDELDQPNAHSRSYRPMLLEGNKGEGEPGSL